MALSAVKGAVHSRRAFSGRCVGRKAIVSKIRKQDQGLGRCASQNALKQGGIEFVGYRTDRQSTQLLPRVSAGPTHRATGQMACDPILEPAFAARNIRV